MAQFADGVVVGSAIVKTIEANLEVAGPAGPVEAFTRKLTAPLEEVNR